MMFQTVVYLNIIYGFPLLVIYCLLTLVSNGLAHFVIVFLSPCIYVTLMPVIAGILSIPYQHSVVAGVFPRSLQNKLYKHRRLYGLCWTALYYFTPIYSIVLLIPAFKRIIFKIFGYNGPDFTTYPDSWLRDLPLLNFGSGVYVSNRATIGTNIVMSDGNILVGKITLGEKCLIGHLAAIAPNANIGERSEIGVYVGIGIGVVIGSDCKIGVKAYIDHHTKIGEKTVVGNFSYIGTRCQIASGLNIPAGCFVPSGTKILTQQEMDANFAKQLAVNIHQSNKVELSPENYSITPGN